MINGDELWEYIFEETGIFNVTLLEPVLSSENAAPPNNPVVGLDMEEYDVKPKLIAQILGPAKEIKLIISQLGEEDVFHI